MKTLCNKMMFWFQFVLVYTGGPQQDVAHKLLTLPCGENNTGGQVHVFWDWRRSPLPGAFIDEAIPLASKM